jgi:hypothetical protein
LVNFLVLTLPLYMLFPLVHIIPSFRPSHDHLTTIQACAGAHLSIAL